MVVVVAVVFLGESGSGELSTGVRASLLSLSYCPSAAKPGGVRCASDIRERNAPTNARWSEMVVQRCARL